MESGLSRFIGSFREGYWGRRRIEHFLQPSWVSNRWNPCRCIIDLRKQPAWASRNRPVPCDQVDQVSRIRLVVRRRRTLSTERQGARRKALITLEGVMRS